MKIAALADQDRKEEIITKKMPDEVECVWVESIAELLAVENAEAYFDLEFKNERHRILSLSKLLPVPVVINAVSCTLKELNQSFIRINAWPGFMTRPFTEIAVLDSRSQIEAAGLFDALQWPYRFVPDLAGMVSPRIISMVINEAYYTFGAGVANKEDIDRAMKLGTNYPFGPFEWARKIGLERIYELLKTLSKSDSRYTISDALVKELNQ